MAIKFNDKRHHRIVQEIVPFNPDWLDKNGFLVNLPGPDLLTNFTLGEKTNRVAGVYVYQQPEHVVSDDKHSMVEAPSIHAELLRFSITKHTVYQDLPRNQKAVIRFDQGIMHVVDHKDRLLQTWRPYMIANVSDDLDQGFTTKWLLNMVINPTNARIPDDAMPTMIGDLFVELTERMDRVLRHSMGYDDDLSQEESNPFPWLFRLAQEDSDSRYNQDLMPVHRLWLSAEPDREMYMIWTRVHQHLQSMRHKSYADRNDREQHGPWLASLREMILEMVAQRNKRFPIAAGIWSTQEVEA